MNKVNSKQINKIAKKYNLDILLLFGSQLREKKYLHLESDFDVAYLSKKDLNLMDEAKLICDLMPVFKSDKVDLVNLKKANPLLMKQIFENHKVLHCKDPKIYYRYKIYAERKYAESYPLFQLTHQLIEKFLQKHAR